MTKEEKINEDFEKHDSCMTRANGDIQAAAGMLGVGKDEFEVGILSNTKLRKKWVESGPLGQSEAMIRRLEAYRDGQKDAIREKATDDTIVRKYGNMSISEASQVLDFEDMVFEKALKGVGFKHYALKHLIGIQKVARSSFKSTIELMHGGLTTSFCHVLDEQNQVREMWGELMKMLSDLEKYPIGSRKRDRLSAEVENLAKMLRGVGAEMIDIATVVQRSTLLSAMLKQHKVKSSKPKFSS